MVRVYMIDGGGNPQTGYWSADYQNMVEQIRALGWIVFAVIREV